MHDSEAKNLAYSVVIPVYNEEQNLEVLYERLTKVMASLSEPYEIIFVDDGSKDMSFHILQGLHEKDNHVKVIRLTRNFGQQMAILAGLDHSKGERVIQMDADLQDPPEEIPKLINKLNENYDVVYAYRKVRHDTIYKKLTSKMYLWMLARLTDQIITSDITSFLAMTRRVVDYTRQCRESNRFHGGLISWLGFPYTSVDVEYGERFAGKTKYSTRKMISLAIEGVVSFSGLPLQFIGFFGLFVSFISFIIGIVILTRQVLWGFPVAGYTSTIVAVFFIGGVLLLVLGALGQYIGRIHVEVKRRPLYIIRDKVE